MTQRSHQLVCSADRARCSCAKWNGTIRALGETAGSFTLRAAQEHEAHAAARRAPKHDGQRTMFQPQEELFS